MKYFPNLTPAALLKLCNNYTIPQLEQMYITENYSMELVSRVTAINLATLSRIFWDFGLPDKKRAVLGDKEYEKKALETKKKINLDNVSESAVWDEL